MAKTVSDAVLDAAHSEVKDNCNLMVACSQEPLTRAEAVTTYALADIAMASGDFTIADDTSGRKCTVAAKAGVPIDTSGTATHIALVDGTRLLRVTTCTPQSLTAGGTVDFPTWKFSIADPT